MVSRTCSGLPVVVKRRGARDAERGSREQASQVGYGAAPAVVTQKGEQDMAQGFVKGSLIGGACGAFLLAALSLGSELPAPPSLSVEVPDAAPPQDLIGKSNVPPAPASLPVTVRATPVSSPPALDDLDALRAEDIGSAGRPRVGAPPDAVGPATMAAPVAGVPEAGPSGRAPALRSVTALDRPKPDGTFTAAAAPPERSTRGPAADPVAEAATGGPPEPAAPDAPANGLPPLTGFADAPAVSASAPVLPVEPLAASPRGFPDNRGFGKTPTRGPATGADILPDKEGTTVRVNRLPTVGSQPVSAPATALAAFDAPATNPDTSMAAPVMRFASKELFPSDRPRMAIVLIDQGAPLSAGAPGFSALRALDYPVSVAVDSGLADARQRMQAYRGAGLEVLAAVDFPQGAQAQDVEVSLGVALSRVPEALAVLHGSSAKAETPFGISGHLAAYLADSGHGLVLQNRGLNTAQRIAERSGVPAAVVFRDIDAEDGSPDAILRLLDQGAFRARQGSGVVMLGRLRPQTLAALRRWASEDRAGEVSLVPLSQVLTTATP